MRVVELPTKDQLLKLAAQNKIIGAFEDYLNSPSFEGLEKELPEPFVIILNNTGIKRLGIRYFDSGPSTFSGLPFKVRLEFERKLKKFQL